MLLKRSCDVSGFLSEVSDAAMKAIIGGSSSHRPPLSALLPACSHKTPGVRAGAAKYINECCRAHGGHLDNGHGIGVGQQLSMAEALSGRDLERLVAAAVAGLQDGHVEARGCVRACVRACVRLAPENE